MLRRNSVQALFNGYYHDNNIASMQEDPSNGNSSVASLDKQ